MTKPIKSIIILLVGLWGCAGNGSKSYLNNTAKESNIKYAKYFTITDIDSISKRVTITDLWSGSQSQEEYKLVKREYYGSHSKEPHTLPYPIKSAICMSSSHVAFLNKLAEAEVIKGISGCRFIYSPSVQKLIEEGKIADVGTESLPNYELIMSLAPDVVFAYGVSGSDNSYISKLRELSIKVMVIGDYLENHPLGRMEYLKLFGQMCGKRAEADSICDSAESKYIEIRERVAKEIKDSAQAKVLINTPYKGVWYIPGEENYMSLLVKDAGGAILGSRKGEVQSSRNGVESIFAMALEAEVWLNPGDMSLNALENVNPLFKHIPALKKGAVYNNSKRKTAAGGSDFWENGAVEPHIILQDLAQILHPAIELESKELVYHYKLE